MAVELFRQLSTFSTNSSKWPWFRNCFAKIESENAHLTSMETTSFKKFWLTLKNYSAMNCMQSSLKRFRTIFWTIQCMNIVVALSKDWSKIANISWSTLLSIKYCVTMMSLSRTSMALLYSALYSKVATKARRCF